jgi:hypothetical protein
VFRVPSSTCLAVDLDRTGSLDMRFLMLERLGHSLRQNEFVSKQVP